MRMLLAALLVVGFTVGGVACSDKTQRDQNYGSDAGLGYQGPAGGVISSPSRDARSGGPVKDAGAPVDSAADADKQDAASD